MIKVVCVGRIKENYLKEAIDEYLKRLQKYTKVKIIEVSDFNNSDINGILKKEQEEILKQIDPKDYIITLEIEGNKTTSIEFAKRIDNIFINYSNITFVIGGSHGLSDEIKKLSNYKLSFSDFTFPHQLFRVMLLEQIYRAYKINNNEEYHK